MDTSVAGFDVVEPVLFWISRITIVANARDEEVEGQALFFFLYTHTHRELRLRLPLREYLLNICVTAITAWLRDNGAGQDTRKASGIDRYLPVVPAAMEIGPFPLLLLHYRRNAAEHLMKAKKSNFVIICLCVKNGRSRLIAGGRF
jgi:hypothetical protein